VLGGLTIHLPVTNFIQFICAKNYEQWLRVDKVIAMKTVCSFWPTLWKYLLERNLCQQQISCTVQAAGISVEDRLFRHKRSRSRST